MIGVISVKCAAHNPNFPLEPVFTFVNSAQSFRILNVPRRIGRWDITKVFVNLNYPDNTTIHKECVLNGNIWIGTVEGCAESGTSTNGFIVTASGIDENENVITNYVLGAGDLYVKDLDGTIDPERVGTKMYFNDTLPSNPKKGDATFIDGVLNVYDGTNWVPVAESPDPSFIIDADGNKIEADRDVIYTDNTKWSVNMDSYGTYVLSQTSIYSWEYVEPEGIEGNKKVVLSYRDGENSWFLEYYQWNPSLSTWYIIAYGRDYESPSTATSLEITIIGDTSIDCTLTRGVVITDKLTTLSDLPTKTSDLTNDSGFITSADVPTKTSDLSNDSGFITTDEVQPYHDTSSPNVNTGIANRAAALTLYDSVNNFILNSSLFGQLRTNLDLTHEFRAKMSYTTYYPYVLSYYDGQTYTPALDLHFCNGRIAVQIGSRPRTIYTGYMFRTSGAGFAIPCSEDATPDGRLYVTTSVQTAYVLVENETTSLHQIGFTPSYFGNDDYKTIDKLDGVQDNILATRANPYPQYATSEEIANKNELPTKTSDLSNDSGFITVEEVPTRTSDLTNDSGFITSSYPVKNDGGVVNAKAMTQQAYDALQTKDSATLYVITEA